MVYTAVTVTVLDNKTGLPVEVSTTLDDKGNFTAATADGKIKLTVADGIETLYDGIGWRFPINPLTFTVTGDCTVTGIDRKELKAAGVLTNKFLGSLNWMSTIWMQVSSPRLTYASSKNSMWKVARLPSKLITRKAVTG
jgi:hypothetical protein